VFALVVIALFVLGLALRLYWSPQAEDARRSTFISDSYNVALTPEKTVGFFNNAEKEPLQRLGLSLTENCFFTRAVTLEMLKRERAIIAVYAAIFLVAVFVRSTDLAIIPIAAQALFSEQLISRWLRLEWLSHRCGAIYNRLYDLFQSPPAVRIRNARILDAFAAYETSKANAGIALSSSIFFKLNPRLSEEWKKVLVALKQAPPGGQP
jgi:Zn-dependent protease with chaperone function